MAGGVLSCTNGPPSSITAAQQMVASCSGAVITSVFVTPLDVVKVRLQKQVRGRTRPVAAAHQMTPLDVVKIRLQAQHSPLANGRCFIYRNGLMDHLCTCVDVRLGAASTDCPWYARPTPRFNGTLVSDGGGGEAFKRSLQDGMVKIAQLEGVRSLWSGLSPTLVMAVPATVMYFTLYDNVNASVSKRLGERFWIPMASGASARFAVVLMISPLEMVRTKLQSQKLSYLEVARAVRWTAATNGVRSLWLGCGPTLLRDVPFSAVYWAGYETLKKYWLNQARLTETTFAISFSAGAIAGSAAAICTLPFDVIKTHRQIELGEMVAARQAKKATSTWELMAKLYRKQGIRGLYAGAVPRIIKIAPACAIMIGCYDYGKVFFAHHNLRKYGTPPSNSLVDV